MTILNASLESELRDIFNGLTNPVTLVVFSRADCESCGDARQLAEELAAISGGSVRVELHEIDSAEAKNYGIAHAPAVVVLGGASARTDFGIRFFGSPAGYEFGALVEDIRLASLGASELGADTIDTLSRLTSPLHLQVFVTPTCPYCPRAVLLAHQMAIASDMVTAAAIDASEFPEWADRYHVRGVPRTVINDSVHIEGAVPEARLMAQLMPLLERT
jgi:glutaredoxin-like protein